MRKNEGAIFAREVMAAQRRLDSSCGPHRLPGYTYVVAAAGSSLLKIGRSEDIVRRLKGLQTASPMMLTLVGLSHGWRLEEILHTRHRRARVRGEWFELETSPIALDVCAGCADEECRRSHLDLRAVNRRSKPALQARRPERSASDMYTRIAGRILAGGQS